MVQQVLVTILATVPASVLVGAMVAGYRMVTR